MHLGEIEEKSNEGSVASGGVPVPASYNDIKKLLPGRNDPNSSAAENNTTQIGMLDEDNAEEEDEFDLEVKQATMSNALIYVSKH